MIKLVLLALGFILLGFHYWIHEIDVNTQFFFLLQVYFCWGCRMGLLTYWWHHRTAECLKSRSHERNFSFPTLAD